MQQGFGRGRSGFLTEEEKLDRPQVTAALIKRILSYLAPYWKQLALVLLAILLATVLRLLPAILTGRIIDEGLIGRDLGRLALLIGLSVGVTLLSNLVGLLESYLNTWVAQHITFNMRNRMFRHLLGMGQRFFTTNRQGDLITRMTSDIQGVQQVIAGTFTSIVSNALTLVVAAAAMYQRNWILATVGLVIVPLFTLPTRRAGKARWTLTREAQERQDEINGILNETLSVSGQLLVKLFGREAYEAARYEEANRQMVRLNIRQSMAGRWFRLVLGTFSSIGPMLIYLVGGVLMMRYDAGLTVGDITVLVTLLSRMYGPVNALMNMQVDWIRSMALFTRIFEYFDLPREVTNTPDAITPQSMKGDIRFEGVSFSYDGERDILKDISFSLSSGRTVAIVGPSGAGKSTIISLLLRLFDVTAGRITVDGTDIRKLDLNFLRENIGLVTQDTYLFNASIRDNLLYARPGANQAELEDACIKANIHDSIKALPRGYDTQVGNRGLKLSGGEKQRLSIARVLLKDPVVTVFDEATSSLDSISESLIQQAVHPMLDQRTSIVIAHRLSSVLAADEILVLKEGRIVQQGAHSALLRQGGLYRQLYETQFSLSQEGEAGAEEGWQG
ncbi:MAG: ABC transporter ATP-binding protein [Eubacteriales bacterium]|nr:ABC transporter ATP-binding protein [Eubacteriales bacterium]MDD4135088.1 ABC transporter ATP-binding protein [Eubacteriales bacterium]